MERRPGDTGTPWLKQSEGEKKLNGLACRRGRVRRGTSKRVRTRFLFGVLVDLDGTFEVGAVFDHDSGSGQVTVDRTILLDFNSILLAKVSLHVTVYLYLTANYILCSFS